MFGRLLVPKWPRKNVVGGGRGSGHLFRDLFRTLILGCILVTLGLHFVPRLVPSGSLRAPFCSILVVLGSNLVPKSALLAPSLFKNRILDYPTLQITTNLTLNTTACTNFLIFFSLIFRTPKSYEIYLPRPRAGMLPQAT